MKKKSYITVFGATGRIGSELLRLLSAAEMPTLAVTRNKSNVPALPFVEWIEADMNDRTSLVPALSNSHTVFLSSAATLNIVEEQCNVIDMGEKEGVSHLVKVSSAMADPDSSLFIARAHGQIEEHLKKSSIEGILLRPNGFMQNWLLGAAHTVKTQRKIFEATGDGKRAHIDLRDIAEVAFHTIKNPGKHACHTYLLTGGEAINCNQLASIIGEAIGEPVTYIAISLEEARQQMENKGVASWSIDTFISYAEDQRNHRAAFISSDVMEILGKPARTVKSFIKEYADRFR